MVYPNYHIVEAAGVFFIEGTSLWRKTKEEAEELLAELKSNAVRNKLKALSRLSDRGIKVDEKVVEEIIDEITVVNADEPEEEFVSGIGLENLKDELLIIVDNNVERVSGNLTVSINKDGISILDKEGNYKRTLKWLQ